MSTIEVEGRRIRLSNLDKVLWPHTGLTKAWMIEYYVRVAPVLLPHLENHPVTLRRFPDGVDGPSWHQNECRGEPDWFQVFETSGRGGRRLRFCVVGNTPSLVWAANQGAIEFHPFQWQVDRPRQPTSLVLDLDPGPPADIVDCARVAVRLRGVLQELGLTALVKTSGSLGLHLHVPLGAPHDGEVLKAFAQALAQTLSKRYPEDVVAEMNRTRRTGKVFVDWLQNDPTRQTVAPYSLRGMASPTVATPVTWREVEESAADRRAELLWFLAEDVLARLEGHGDLFSEAPSLVQTLPG